MSLPRECLSPPSSPEPWEALFAVWAMRGLRDSDGPGAVWMDAAVCPFRADRQSEDPATQGKGAPQRGLIVEAVPSGMTCTCHLATVLAAP